MIIDGVIKPRLATIPPILPQTLCPQKVDVLIAIMPGVD